jgi:outer membrane protein TolC
MKRFAAFAALVLLASGSAFGEPAVISQNDILARAGSHELVSQARIALELRTGMLFLESGWQGASMTLLPTMLYDDATGQILLAETAVGVDFSFPSGTSAAERERRLQASELVSLSRSELDDALGRAYSDLFSLYAASYSAQETMQVLEKELTLARLRLDAVNQKNLRGLASVSDQADAEAEYQAAAEKIIQARLDARLSWFNLASAASLEVTRPGSGTPSAEHGAPTKGIVFDLPVFARPDLDAIIKTAPQPGILMAAAKDRNPAVLAQRQKLAIAYRALATHSPLDLNITPKFLYAMPTASASIGYGTATGVITLGTDWSPYVNADSSTTKTEPADNSFSVSIGISGSINPKAAAEKATLQATVRLEELKLLALEQGLELSVRSKYAAYLKAKDSLSEAERAGRQAREISAANQTRRTLGQLSPEDEAADAVLLGRSSLNVEKARISLGQAYFGMIAASNAWDLAGLSINGVKP